MLLKSYAKINLSLKLSGVREDGYHLLDMVELPIDLHDVLEINHNHKEHTSHVTCDEVRLLKVKDNLCNKALDVMRQEYKFNDSFDIFIHKIIPFAAGLGGGSSNGASTMKGINSILNLKASNEDLAKLSLKIGADVPFFFSNCPARVTGIGDVISPIMVGKNFYVVLIKPEKGCSTKEIYSICDNYERKPINNDLVIQGLITGDEDLIAENIGNDLMDAAMATNDQIAGALDKLKSEGFKIVSMSGSGSTVFGMSKDKHKCVKVYKKLLKQGYDAYLSKVIKQ